MATIDGAVQATIDGEVVIERSNGSTEGFDQLALTFFPGEPDDFVLFDDVRAEVP